MYEFTDNVKRRTSSSGIHLLVDVAGEHPNHKSCTTTPKDNIEYSMQVNLLSHQVLIDGLLTSLRNGATKRVELGVNNDSMDI